MAARTVPAGERMILRDYLANEQRRIETEIDRLCPPDVAPPSTIHRAMRYSLLAGGKRIRPILFMEAARAIRDDVNGIEPAACSVEMIHTYSLIHDDLPALDNDDFSRGKPTNHKVFGEAMAILAGDALLTLAFITLCRLPDRTSDIRLQLIAELSSASGTIDGMIGGQVADIEGERQPPTPELLRYIHHAKTGALLRASLRMGAIWAEASAAQLEALTRYGEHVGLAFQIVDDILDIEESSAALGKTAGKDADQGKITFPAVYGLERSREMARVECTRAHESLTTFGSRAARLREIADMIVSRKS
jgi:geranylgeranyl diphosphate synthase type II